MEMLNLKGREVSKLCFGSLTMGPLQKNLKLEEGSHLIERAYELGVNFIDTAELYGTYPYIREAIKRLGGKLVIASKSYAYDREGAKASVEKARQEMNIDYIDAFMMHEQESVLTLAGHREALEYYLEQRERGLIGAVGVSTHRVEVVNACADMNEIDIIHPIINVEGLGILDGSREDMMAAIEKASKNGKFILGMKPLGGGNLLNDENGYQRCMDFVIKNQNIHSIAMGMQTLSEIEMNVAIFEGKDVPKEVLASCENHYKQLHVADWCQGCGNCENRCKMDAIKVISGVAVVDEAKCVTCGYCSAECADFALKIY